jgi:hypothetical protein
MGNASVCDDFYRKNILPDYLFKVLRLIPDKFTWFSGKNYKSHPNQPEETHAFVEAIAAMGKYLFKKDDI